MSDVAISQVLEQMRSLSAAAGAENGAAPGRINDAAASGEEFAKVLGESLGRVNELQQEAGQMTASFQRGDPGVDIARVMVSLEKAGLAFEAVTQTRNRLLSAYRDIMNMPV